VTWTAKKATEVALTFGYRPMVKGHMRKVHCRIVARYPDHEATTICRGLFVSPPDHTRRFVARFSLDTHGGMRPYCSTKWTMSPYCNKKGHVKTRSEL
jgi:hypothetical protein